MGILTFWEIFANILFGDLVYQWPSCRIGQKKGQTKSSNGEKIFSIEIGSRRSSQYITQINKNKDNNVNGERVIVATYLPHQPKDQTLQKNGLRYAVSLNVLLQGCNQTFYRFQK